MRKLQIDKKKKIVITALTEKCAANLLTVVHSQGNSPGITDDPM